MTISYSLIIPVKNEADNILILLREIENVISQLGNKEKWEIIYVEDGSTDHTPQLLQEIIQSKPYVKALFFAKNYGQSSAFAAGFQAARGEFIITMDGDGQNDPADIPKLLKEIPSCDLVCGIRQKRQDRWSKKITSLCANYVRNWLCQDNIKDTGCSLKIYRKSCLEKVKMYEGMHRFLPTLFLIEGFKVVQLPVNHRARLSGKSHYHFFNRSFNTIADLLAVAWMRKRHLHYTIKKELSSSNYNDTLNL